MGVKFLLRFDDMCPTINWDVWQKLEDVMIEEDVRPILSVIPDNQDPILHECEPNERFWERVRAWQARGWTIGLHGYQHRYVSRNCRHRRVEALQRVCRCPSRRAADQAKAGARISLLARACVRIAGLRQRIRSTRIRFRFSLAWVSVRSATAWPFILIAILKT